MTNSQKKPDGIAAFSKFIHVLQTVADCNNSPTIIDLIPLLPYPKATVYRIVNGLIAEGLLDENEQDGTLLPGVRLVHFAEKSQENSYIRQHTNNMLALLLAQTNETVHLTVPVKDGMVYIEKLESAHNVRMVSKIGHKVSFYSSSVGKAYLAALSDEAREEIYAHLKFIPFTSHTISNLDQLKEEIALTRQRGYSIDHQENEPDIQCFGAAILDKNSKPIACISISVPIFRLDDDHSTYTAPLLKAVFELSRTLTGRSFITKADHS